MLAFLKPHFVFFTWMMLLSHSAPSSRMFVGLFAKAEENVYEQRSDTVSVEFTFEPVRGDGNLPQEVIAEWENLSSAFFAQMFSQINGDENTTVPMLAPGVIIEVAQQDRYEYAVTNNGDIVYGVSLQGTFLATYQTNPESSNINLGKRIFRIFDKDSKGNLLFLIPYLSQFRQNNVLSPSFLSVNRMSINVKNPQQIDLASPIPTLPLPPPTDTPSQTPSRNSTPSPSPLPTKTPTSAPSLYPSFTPFSETLEPTEMPNSEPTNGPPIPQFSPTQPPIPQPIVTRPPISQPIVTRPPIPQPTLTLPPITQPTLTLPPTTTSSKAPDDTMSPTLSPKLTASPTKNPTAAPTLQVESFFATSRLTLRQVKSSLDLNATDSFQRVTAGYLSIHIQELLKDTTVEAVTVGLSSQNLLSDVDRRRRRLQDRLHVMRRREQEKNFQEEEDVPNALLVEFNTILKIRSASSVNAPSLVQSAFGTSGRRESYRLLLVATEDPILKTVTQVDLSDGNVQTNNAGVDIATEQPEGGLGTPALIGIGVGVTLFAVAILGIWYQANNRKDDSSVNSQKGQIPTAEMSADESGVPRGRLDAEIVVDKSQDDVSTLGDPFFGMTLEERTCADKTATSASVQQSYDFLKLVGKGKNALLGTTTVEGDEEETTASKVRRNTLFADDDASFEDMFGEMK